MNNKIVLTSLAWLLASGLAAAQTQEQDHKAHHPEGAAASAPAAKPAAGPAMAMKAMQDMHQKMMDAKTPEERQALMGEHMKAMQGGMDMMMKMNKKSMSMPADPKARMTAMEQRMDMMQMMMEMMMDRMPAATMQGSSK